MSEDKTISKNIHELIIDNNKIPDKIRWINIIDAHRKEIGYLRKNFNFNLEHLKLASSKTTAKRPYTKKENDYLFMVIHFPVLKEGNIVSAEIEFFVGKNYFITIHNGVKALNDFFKYCKKDRESTLSYQFESVSILLYELLEKLMLNCYDILDDNNITIDEIENLIFSEESKKAASAILSLRRNIINTRRAIRDHKDIINELCDYETGLISEKETRKYYNKLLEQTKRVWEALENQKEMIEVLNGTNESFMNYRLNDIMKTLTIFSVIVFPLTLLAGIFGMNTVNAMPFMNHPFGFWVIILIMFIGSLCMLIFFKKKRWI